MSRGQQEINPDAKPKLQVPGVHSFNRRFYILAAEGVAELNFKEIHNYRSIQFSTMLIQIPRLTNSLRDPFDIDQAYLHRKTLLQNQKPHK